MTSHGNWMTAQLVAVCTLIVALIAFLHRGSQEAKWPIVPGTIQDTRIIADQVLQTRGARK